MKKILIFTMLFATMWSTQTVVAQTSSDHRTLMTINGKPVYVDEFLYVFQKSNQSSSIEKETMDQYLERYINFRLKVEEAISRGMDTTEAFRKELKGYRAQATPKYLRDNAAIDSLVRLSYQRMRNLRRAAHIVIECKEDASDSAQQVALHKIEYIRELAMKNKSQFGELAQTYSSDPNAKENSGELGWITPFRYVYCFENAVYNTPVGEITEVFRSPYGYHIALVEEEDQMAQEVHAAHIMKMVQRGNEEQVAKAKDVIDSIYARLQAGDDFAETARNFSDDKGSAIRGGDLNWFGKGMMVKPFEDAAFAMQTGTVSEPFQSQFGWHIIKLYEKRDILPLDSLYDQVLRNVQHDERMKEEEKSFLRKTRQEYNLPDTMTDEEVMDYADQHLEDKYPDFKNLVQEYHDGILLFGISMEEVWDKAGKDSTGLEHYFQEHKTNYHWDEPRYKGYMVYAHDKKSMQRAELIVKNSNPDSIKSFIDQRLNNDSVKLAKVVYGIWKKGKKPEVDKYIFRQKNDYTPTENFPFVKGVRGKIMKKPEHYTDVLNQVANDYQDMLDTQWVEILRQKYNVQVNDTLFQEIKKTYSDN